MAFCNKYKNWFGPRFMTLGHITGAEQANQYSSKRGLFKYLKMHLKFNFKTLSWVEICLEGLTNSQAWEADYC